MEQYAYIRVSTKEQNIDRQILALEEYHIPRKNIYCDWQSGKDFACKMLLITQYVLRKSDRKTIKTLKVDI